MNILRLKNEDHIYVGFVLNSLIGRLQTQKLKSGAAQAELYPCDIDEFIIPFVKKNLQINISNSVTSSLSKKRLAQYMIEIAKKGLEMAIEKNEKDAQNWINAELKKLGVEITT